MVYSEILRPNIERKKKEIGLSIAVTTNILSANYLDVSFDLTTDICKPYRKLNDEPIVQVNIPTIPQILYDKFHQQ